MITSILIPTVALQNEFWINFHTKKMSVNKLMRNNSRYFKDHFYRSIFEIGSRKSAKNYVEILANMLMTFLDVVSLSWIYRIIKWGDDSWCTWRIMVITFPLPSSCLIKNLLIFHGFYHPFPLYSCTFFNSQSTLHE